MREKPLSRRSFVLGAASSIALGACAPAMEASRTASSGRKPSPLAKLPEQSEVVVRNAHVLTMDPSLGDIEGGDVHVRGGEIVAVGRALVAPNARAIDGRKMIVLPGLVETHWHMWNSLLRSMAGDERKIGYFPTSAGLGRFFAPSDMYCGTRLAASEALNSGITTVHDWCHNARTPEHADENLRALRETGIRGRFSYGPARGIPVTETLNLPDVERLHRDWGSYSNGGLLTLGVAWRGVQYAVTGADGTVQFRPIPPEVYRKEYDLARSLDLPLSAHVNIGWKVDFGHVAALERAGLLYPDLQLIHMISSTPEEIQAVAKAGCPVSFSPYTEMRTGFGFPKASNYLDAGVRVGLSVDTTTLSGDADMFAIMKVIENIENGIALSEFKMPARRVLEMGTIMGAHSLGLGDRIGSLASGKRADLIMVDTRAINIGMFTDPAHLIVEAAQPANVDLVMVDGRVLKERGKLTAIDREQVVDEASAANLEVRKRAEWW